MTAKEYKRQTDIVKHLRLDNEITTARLEFRYGHIKYNLFGEYHKKGDCIEWTLFKHNKKTHTVDVIKHPDSNIDTPLTVLKTMAQFEHDTLLKYER